MINAQHKTARSNQSTLCMALAKHALLLKSGLTAHEAECAIFTPELERALDASTARVQENFGLYMQYQVKQAQQEKSASLEAVANSVISMSGYIARKYQQTQTKPDAYAYADSELSHASR